MILPCRLPAMLVYPRKATSPSRGRAVSSYSGALFAHVLLVVYMLGADLGRAYVAHIGSSLETDPPARWLATRVAVWLGSATNIALVLMLPAGVSLGAVLGVYEITSTGWLVATWVVTIVWLLISIGAERAARTSKKRHVEIADMVVRLLIAPGYVYDGAIVFQGASQTVQAEWLGSKIILYGLLILVSIPVRWLSFDLIRASTTDDAAAAARKLGQLRMPIAASWVLILLAAWFGVAKPL